MAIIFSSYISTKATVGMLQRVDNNAIPKLGKEQMKVVRGSF